MSVRETRRGDDVKKMSADEVEYPSTENGDGDCGQGWNTKE